MKLRIVGLAVACAITLGGEAHAQNVPEQFVVSGSAAEKLQDFTTINLATAERIVEACEKAATDQGVQISVMVLDHAGNQVYIDRMDGQGYTNFLTTEMKARTALLDRGPSKDLMNLVAQDPTREMEESHVGFFPVSGGLPIVVNKQLIGVVGASGSLPHLPVWSDEICAHKALLDVIDPSVAPLSQDLPPRANPNPGTAPVPRFVAAAPPKPNVPAEFVVSGKAAGNIFEGNQISLAAAKKVARACRDYAAAKGSGMSLYVLDNAGEYVHMERTDGQTAVNQRAALLKAQAALKTRQPTSIVAAQLKNNPSSIPRFFAGFDLFEVAGGIPIVVDGQMIGAVGVGGYPGGTEECAIEGLKAAFGDHVTLPVYPAAKSAAQ